MMDQLRLIAIIRFVSVMALHGLNQMMELVPVVGKNI